MKHTLADAALRATVMRQSCRAEAAMRNTLQQQTARAAERRMTLARTERVATLPSATARTHCAVQRPVGHGVAGGENPKDTVRRLVARNAKFGVIGGAA